MTPLESKRVTVCIFYKVVFDGYMFSPYFTHHQSIGSSIHPYNRPSTHPSVIHELF